MIKHSLFILCLAASSLFGQGSDAVDILIDAPSNVVAGNDFQVKVTINKGSLSDYSRFSQDLPLGVTAKNISSPNADFTYDENERRIRIIWLKMPADNSISVEYAISVDERLSGPLELGGTFAYVKEGERAFINARQEKQVNILPNPDLDPSKVIAIADFESVIKGGTGSVVSAPQVKSTLAIREKPSEQTNGMVYVTILVKKPEGTNFMKIDESIPGGYTFEAIDKHKAIVSQAAATAKFVWMTLPREQYFTIQYRLVPILEKTQETIAVKGTLTYSESGETRVEDIVERAVNIAALSDAQRAELLKSGTVPSGLEKVEMAATKPEKKVQGPAGNPEKASQTGKQSATPVKQVKTTTSKQLRSGSGVLSISPLTSASGTYFRVQVSAVKNPYFTNVVFAEYDLLKEVTVETSGVWHKYTIGSFDSYNEAAKAKKEIQKATPFKDLFIVAYRDGKRIPISEATK